MTQKILVVLGSGESGCGAALLASTRAIQSLCPMAKR